MMTEDQLNDALEEYFKFADGFFDTINKEIESALSINLHEPCSYTILDEEITNKVAMGKCRYEGNL